MKEIIYDKLVRDKIPEIIEKSGKQCEIEILSNEKYLEMIDKKLDEELMESLKANHKLVITLEDGTLEGGFGEKIASYFGNSDMKVLNFGARKEFTDRVPLEELYQRYHLTPEQIVDDIKKRLS